MQKLFSWVRPGLYLKRWLLLILLGIIVISIGFVLFVNAIGWRPEVTLAAAIIGLITSMIISGILFSLGFSKLHKLLIAPLISPNSIGEWISSIQTQQSLRHGIKVVAIGGGTGLPSTLRAMKTETRNITAVVTMADDGGSSGRLRRELGMQPPGDLRSNITALARDEDLMTQLFAYRFSGGELQDHSFGNLFLAALVGMMGSMDHAAAAAGRVLAIQGRVLPCTLEDVYLVADVQDQQTGDIMQVEGESNIPKIGRQIRRVYLKPERPPAFPEVLTAIQEAELIIIGPGSLYTSILPNLLADGVVEAIRASHAIKVYVCNIATQPEETHNYHVADHVAALEAHVGERLIDVVLANNHYPIENAGPNTIYVQPVPPRHAVNKRYRLIYSDLTDDERPWRHSPDKLRATLLKLQTGGSRQN